MASLEKTAERIKAFQERIYIPRHEYRDINANDFRHLDLTWYDRTRDLLTSRGCVLLGDIEDVTLKGTWGDFRTFIRMLVTSDGTASVGLFHPKPKLWLRLVFWALRIKLGRIVDCETEMSDGSYLVTTNAMQASKLEPPPGFDNEFHPHDTAAETVFESHLRRLQTYFACHASVTATRLQTQADVLNMQHRIEIVKAAHRKRIGYGSVSELERLGADSQTAEKIKQAMDRSP